ncbi:MAG: D-alanine--D-alanine ligase [Deltaproteobacteria bacterium]|nr:D-alanine--D-alanine ligase [Deltaproteobacteria bacterium]
MRVAVLRNAVSPQAALEDQDTLTQTLAVLAALDRAGIEAFELVMDRGPDEAARQAKALGAAVVFNLVEAVDGSARQAHLVPAAMRRAEVACTGSGSRAMLLSTSKILCKTVLARAEIPAPPLFRPGLPGDWIIKSVWEHASFGLDADSILSAPDRRTMRRTLTRARSTHGGAWFAEAFVPGREFNLALIRTPKGPRVLPPAEIRFDAAGSGGHHIVDWAAKWDESSAAYARTPRTFDFPTSDKNLLTTLGRLALRCWEAFGLDGYARVDFRVHPQDGPMVIDVNANPCLSPDAGFAAALDRAGLAYEAVMAGLVEFARGPRPLLLRNPKPCFVSAASSTTC